jgi:hypothetical protein
MCIYGSGVANSAGLVETAAKVVHCARGVARRGELLFLNYRNSIYPSVYPSATSWHLPLLGRRSQGVTLKQVVAAWCNLKAPPLTGEVSRRDGGVAEGFVPARGGVVGGAELSSK